MDAKHPPHTYFIIAGSTKCGTTSLFKYFQYHPQVCASAMKESRYFWYNDYPLITIDGKQGGFKNYDDLFNGCKHRPVRMEATPDYLYSERSANALREIPGTKKILFVVRNPVERLWSWYNYAIQSALLDPQISFEVYVQDQLNDDLSVKPQHLRALEQGRYYQYLNMYANIFPKEEMKIIYFEDLTASPQKVCKDICCFLNIEQGYFDSLDFPVYNKTIPVKSTVFHNWFRKVRRGLRPMVNKMPISIGEKARSASKKIEGAYYILNSSVGDRNFPTLSAERLTLLNAYYSDSIIKLKNLTGTLPPWSIKMLQ